MTSKDAPTDPRTGRPPRMGVGFWRRPATGRRSSGLKLLTGVAVIGLTLAGYSSASASSSAAPRSSDSSPAAAASGVSLARQVVAQWEKTPTWQGPTQKFKASRAKGKTADLINLTEEIPALHEWAAVAQRELQRFGVHANVCDAQGTPEGITSCLTEDIAARPNVIVAMALDTRFAHSYFQEAIRDGIKVITAQTGTPGRPHGTGAVAEVTFNYPQVGRILGAWFAASSDCHGYPQIVTSTSSRQPSLAEVAGIKSALKSYCPRSKPLPVANSLIPDWPTTLATTTRSLLTANSKIRYMLPLYDGMTIYMVPAIEQLHLSYKVQVGSFNATPVVIENELAKSSPLAADVGGPNDWYGYALADETLRVLTGTKVVVNEKVPLRLFTHNNLHSINVKKNESTWYGPVSFTCRYDALWERPCH